MTPSEFMYAYLGWSDLEQSRLKQSWERERWSVWIQTSIQLDKKDRLSMTDMFPLPWESSSMQKLEDLTMQERRERVKRILNTIKNEV